MSIARAVDSAGAFSRSGLAVQDNDLILITDQPVVDAFEANFDRIWARAQNVRAFDGPTSGEAR